MNKLVPMLIELTLIPMLFMTACSSSAAGEVKADLNKEFRLPVGQAAVITGEGLTIKFEAVTSDSRCPQGVTCIWAGEAACNVTVTLNKTPKPYTLIVGGSGTGQTVIQGYTLNFNVEPYPQAQKTTDKNSYIMIMKVSK